jgi:hypothetical protein
MAPDDASWVSQPNHAPSIWIIPIPNINKFVAASPQNQIGISGRESFYMSLEVIRLIADALPALCRTGGLLLHPQSHGETAFL